MITNIEKNKKDFKLGMMFLKKYQVIFNSESNSMPFYKNNNLEIDVTTNKSKKNIINLQLYFYWNYIFRSWNIFWKEILQLQKKNISK